MHRAWIVAASGFVALLAAAAIRATFGLLMEPLMDEFGWSHAAISTAASVNLVGPRGVPAVDGPHPRSWQLALDDGGRRRRRPGRVRDPPRRDARRARAARPQTLRRRGCPASGAQPPTTGPRRPRGNPPRPR